MSEVITASEPRRNALPGGINPLLHYALLPLRVLFILASTAAISVIFALGMVLHGARQLLALIPGVTAVANGWHVAYHAAIYRLGRRILKDPRDEPILAAVISLILTTVPVFVVQLIVVDINWFLVLTFYALVFGPKLRGFVRTFSAWHQEVHRRGGILKGPSPFERVFGFTFIALLFSLPTGQIQSGVAHVMQHHRENAGEDDAFESAGYNHASLWDFYRFMIGHVFYQIFLITPYLYFKRRGRDDLAAIQIKGNLVYFAFVLPIALYSWQIAVFYVLVPWLASAFILGLNNWVQHPFYGGRADGDNYMTNTVTLLETPVNFLNEGYHLVHHHRAGLHWTESPQEFEAMREQMKKADSIVIRDLGVPDLFLYLTVLGAFNVVARKYEPWEPMTHEEKVAHLKLRSQALSGAEAEVRDTFASAGQA
ncbi:hypothetical protein CAI21_10650 [Alkalilimnicola ehrlichii]|uniref:Fatty acid desaturase domain-containing protein n=1 Tax=Alkalilimnicola ehrlichii TaxID=351052 RepID=A0A3E0WVE5_9GAMM|nr:fatty acid desaturase [Alkalilimnicola ehrlichii]RFA29218.1 hypothetical protein CAI21_10650 [Alkalilimnicola ehrlichii]RFA36131.1 hypothetical protein CAL65_11800 [Alkalilimnicola ehrlichii]